MPSTPLPNLVAEHLIPAAFALLPVRMRSREALRQMLAIAWQESRVRARVQQTAWTSPDWWLRGPARGLWQFERGGGVRGVLRHPASAAPARHVLGALGYPDGFSERAVHVALADNDVLAAAFARLLLWTDPGRLPDADEPELGWEMYQRTWRPGKPHPETWPQAWAFAGHLAP